MKKILYSTNVFLKLLIQEKYFSDEHFVWCSEYFDCDSAPRLTSASLVPPSSNPRSIYNELKRDIDGKDKHSAKISAQKASFISRAIESHKSGLISEDEKEEIIYMVDDAPFDYWRPLLYVIPSDLVSGRLSTVPIASRAGYGNEYTINGLLRNEFDIVEF